MTLKDSYGRDIERGDVIGMSFIGFSGSGCTQHLVRTRAAFNGSVYTIKTSIDCPGNTYKRGTALSKVLRYAEFSKVLRGRQIGTFPAETFSEQVLVFDDDFPFKDKVNVS